LLNSAHFGISVTADDKWAFLINLISFGFLEEVEKLTTIDLWNNAYLSKKKKRYNE
jgi:hypothetical protein